MFRGQTTILKFKLVPLPFAHLSIDSRPMVLQIRGNAKKCENYRKLQSKGFKVKQ